MDAARVLHDISYGSELIALLATVFFYARRRGRISLLLLLLMSVIAATETVGKFKDLFHRYIDIFLVQNIEMLFEIATYLFIYLLTVWGAGLKRWIGGFLLAYIVFSILSSLYLQPLYRTFPTFSIVLGGLFILVSVLIYFYEELRNAERRNLYRDPLFYISIGLFIFYANEIPVMTLLNYYLAHGAKAPKVHFVFNLKLVVSILYYALYSFGILWTTRK